MKKILIFSTAYFPLVGGAEVAIKQITDRLTDTQFDMITAKMDKNLPAFEKIGQINIYRAGWGIKTIDKFWLVFYGAYLAKKLHRQNHYDAIWSIMASYNGFAAASFKKRHPKIPFLLTLQEGDPLDYIEKKVKWFRRWFREIFTRADYIQAISKFLAGWAGRLGAKCPIEVVPNGVDLNNFSIFPGLAKAKPRADNYQLSIKDLKEKLGVREKEKVIITVSRLVVKNGVGDLIEGIEQLTINNKQSAIKLLILGTGPLEKSLKFKVENLKLKDKVLFLGSMMPEEVPQYLAISDVFVRPSLSEGLGNVFLEAMAAGVPVIGTRVGGIPDFLIDGETGLFCEVRNPKSIAEKISLLLPDENLRQKLIANGKKLVMEKYDWDKIAAQMEKIFHRILRD